jgi:2'-hydroxyisoflavone reductase
MKLLVFGGTQFVGRHLVRTALDRGHQVTLFNRGRTNPGLFPEAERILGDRRDDLSKLDGGRWDAVLDVNGYVPRVVRAAAEKLRGAAGFYAFISTVSVYADKEIRGLHESSPLAAPKPEEEGGEEITPGSYGWLKAGCERAVEEAWPDRSSIVRPGLVVGPYDPTGRFPYWPWRVAQGGEVLAPAVPDQPLQLVDGRDLAEWTIRSIEEERAGPFTATGPDRSLTLGELLDVCREVSGSGARITWVDEDFLLERGVEPFRGLPLWIPGSEADGFYGFDNRKAVAAGLTFRPLAETVRDTFAWLSEAGGDIPARPGEKAAHLTLEREAELLQEWHIKKGGNIFPGSST